MQVHEQTAISMVPHPLKVWGLIADVHFILKHTHLENFSHPINNLHQNMFTIEEESNRDLVFLDTLLKESNGKVSVLVYRKPTHTDKCLSSSSHQQTRWK